MKNSLLTLWLYATVVLSTLFASPVFANDSFLQKEINCLARNIYFEANAEPEEGKVAVAQVTVNRAKNTKYPNSVCKVVHQRSTVAKTVVCQFSWTCSKKSNSNIDRNEFLVAQQIATQVLANNRAIPKLKDALYFHSTRVRPKWNLVRVATIGNHVFYRDKPNL